MQYSADVISTEPNRAGLTAVEAASRLAEYGPNDPTTSPSLLRTTGDPAGVTIGWSPTQGGASPHAVVCGPLFGEPAKQTSLASGRERDTRIGGPVVEIDGVVVRADRTAAGKHDVADVSVALVFGLTRPPIR
jgi:hypothetical protein